MSVFMPGPRQTGQAASDGAAPLMIAPIFMDQSKDWSSASAVRYSTTRGRSARVANGTVLQACGRYCATTNPYS